MSYSTGSLALQKTQFSAIHDLLTISLGATNMKKELIITLAALSLLPIYVKATEEGHSTTEEASDEVVSEQRAMLEKNTKNKGFGPQSPRDIDAAAGNNPRSFNSAPAYTEMNLCNIHFHKNAEHKGGEFSKYAGNVDGHGFQSGFEYSGKLSVAEHKSVGHDICPGKQGALSAGDTIEVHYVHSSAQIEPGPTLDSCLSDTISNPQLRVEAQVYVLVNESNALDFYNLTKHEIVNGLHQVVNIPSNTGVPIKYAGSTTGPSYNEKGSPFHVSWSVRPKVAKVNIETVGKWCKGNSFNEDHAHGVRNLVTNLDLLSKITH
jgi:hypothetical protein